MQKEAIDAHNNIRIKEELSKPKNNILVQLIISEAKKWIKKSFSNAFLQTIRAKLELSALKFYEGDKASLKHQKNLISSIKDHPYTVKNCMSWF